MRYGLQRLEYGYGDFRIRHAGFLAITYELVSYLELRRWVFAFGCFTELALSME